MGCFIYLIATNDIPSYLGREFVSSQGYFLFSFLILISQIVPT